MLKRILPKEVKMEVSRRGCLWGIAELNGDLYANIGGMHFTMLQRYNRAKDRWDDVKRLRENAAMTVLNGELYITGGRSVSFCFAVELHHPRYA